VYQGDNKHFKEDLVMNAQTRAKRVKEAQRELRFDPELSLVDMMRQAADLMDFNTETVKYRYLGLRVRRGSNQ
jgi:hypothetical protein